MSYILDALRKSEQERQRGTPPGIQAVQVHVPVRPIGKRAWPWLIGLVLLANAALLVWWGEPWKDKKSELKAVLSEVPTAQAPEDPAGGAARSGAEREKPAPAASHTQQSPPVEPVSAASPRTAESPRAPELPRPTTTPARKTDERPAAVATRPSTTPPVGSTGKGGQAQPADGAKPDPGPAIKSPPAAGPKTAESVRGDETKRSASKPGLTVNPASPQPGQPAFPTTTPGAREAGLIEDLQPLRSETRPARKEPDYRQVPSSLKEGMPKVSLSFLVYSQKPADRRVTINGRVLREGDEVSDGLKLEAITQEGAVLSYKGFRFHKGVF